MLSSSHLTAPLLVPKNVITKIRLKLQYYPLLRMGAKLGFSL